MLKTINNFVLIEKLFCFMSDFEVLELFFHFPYLPTDKNIAEKINNTETIIDEIICGKELCKIIPIVITTINTIPNIGSHF